MLPISRVMTRGLTVYVYSMIYDNYRLWTFPWDSLQTWLLAAIGADLAYYWIHRAAHG